MVLANHGTIVGGVRAPFPTADFSSYLLQAQQSKAKVIALANAGTDTINAIKQSKDFGIVAGGQEVVAVLLFLTDVDALGLDAAQGLLMSTSFYWDQNDEARAWSKKFGARMGGRMPTDVQAGVGSAAGTYLRAVQATGTDDGPICREVDEGASRERLLRRRTAGHPPRRSHGKGHVPCEGEEAVGVEGALGLPQDREDRSRQRGIPAAEPKRMSSRKALNVLTLLSRLSTKNCILH